MDMPILIQDLASDAFLTAEGEWTPRPQQAVSFDRVLRAWDEVYDRSLCGVRIVFQPKEKERKGVSRRVARLISARF